jgi:hypothetical protein
MRQVKSIRANAVELQTACQEYGRPLTHASGFKHGAKACPTGGRHPSSVHKHNRVCHSFQSVSSPVESRAIAITSPRRRRLTRERKAHVSSLPRLTDQPSRVRTFVGSTPPFEAGPHCGRTPPNSVDRGGTRDREDGRLGRLIEGDRDNGAIRRVDRR